MTMGVTTRRPKRLALLRMAAEAPFRRKSRWAQRCRPPAPASSSRRKATSSPTNHVVENAETIKVTLDDKRQLNAKVIRSRRGHGPSGAEGRGRRALPLCEFRRPGQAARGRLGAGHRQPLGARRHGHGGHRLHHRTQPEGPVLPVLGLHPDRRPHQSGQLGRSDLRRLRTGDRGQQRRSIRPTAAQSASASTSRRT